MSQKDKSWTVKSLAGEIRDLLRAFGRECMTLEGQIILGYILIFATHRTVRKSHWVTATMKEYIPYGGHSIIRKDLVDLVFYGLIPLLLILFLHRRSPLRDFALKLPERKWIWLTGAIFALQLIGILIAVRIPSMRQYYPMFTPARAGGAVFWEFQILALAAMTCWELVNRGYLLFGLKKRFGLSAVLIQTIPFVIMHFRKPTVELYFSAFDGIGLGLLAFASGSIWPGVFLHGIGAMVLDIVLVYGQ